MSGVSDYTEEIMGVVVGEMREGDKDDVILCPDKKWGDENMKKNTFSAIKGLSLILVGALIPVITVS